MAASTQNAVKNFHVATNRWHITRIAVPVRTPFHVRFMPRDTFLSDNLQEHIIFTRNLIGLFLRGGMFVFASTSKYTHHCRAIQSVLGALSYLVRRSQLEAHYSGKFCISFKASGLIQDLVTGQKYILSSVRFCEM